MEISINGKIITNRFKFNPSIYEDLSLSKRTLTKYQLYSKQNSNFKIDVEVKPRSKNYHIIIHSKNLNINERQIEEGLEEMGKALEYFIDNTDIIKDEKYTFTINYPENPLYNEFKNNQITLLTKSRSKVKIKIEKDKIIITAKDYLDIFDIIRYGISKYIREKGGICYV